MATNLDVLNNTLQDFKGPIEQAFAQKTPMSSWLEKKGRVSTEKGKWIERNIMGGSPAQGTKVITGGEKLKRGRAEKTKKIRVQCGRGVVVIDIPKIDLKQNEGKLGVIKLLELYPATVQTLIPVDFDRFWFSGVSAGFVFQTDEMTCWNTLNGQKTFTDDVIGVTNGLLDFADPSAQSDTVQDLAKSSSYNYVNQHQEITSFALDGMDGYETLFRNCAQYIPSPDGVPDVCFVDFDSYSRIMREQRSHVHLTVAGDESEKKKLLQTEIAGVTIQAAKNIILTDFTGSAASGVGYCFSMEGVEQVWYQKPEMSDFSDVDKNQDAVTATMEMMFAMLITNMRCQGTIVGGARA